MSTIAYGAGRSVTIVNTELPRLRQAASDQRRTDREQTAALQANTETLRAIATELDMAVQAEAPPVRVSAPSSAPSATPRTRVLPSAPTVIERGPVRFTFGVDRAMAAPGDSIIYTATVENTSDTDWPEVRITSHVPEHTTFVSICPGHEGVETQPNGDVSVCVPGGPAAPGEHGVQFGSSNVHPGEMRMFSFEVVVSPDAVHGSTIRNHAHARSPSFAPQDSADVPTEVRS